MDIKEHEEQMFSKHLKEGTNNAENLSTRAVIQTESDAKENCKNSGNSIMWDRSNDIINVEIDNKVTFPPTIGFDYLVEADESLEMESIFSAESSANGFTTNPTVYENEENCEASIIVDDLYPSALSTNEQDIWNASNCNRHVNYHRSTILKEAFNERQSCPPQSNTQSEMYKPYFDLLDPKYKNVDIRKLFPEFGHEKPQRFRRLFQTNKSSNLPRIWSGVKNKRKRYQKSSTVTDKLLAESKDTSLTEIQSSEDWKPDISNSPPPLHMVESDDEEKIMKSALPALSGISTTNVPLEVQAWRQGPAKLWYDMLDVPENGEGFDYGFKLSQNDDSEEIVKDDYPDEAYLMVTQYEWENDVIWDGDECKDKVLGAMYNKKNNIAGWIPTKDHRTWAEYNRHSKILSNSVQARQLTEPTVPQNESSKYKLENEQTDTWWSLLPVENEQLINGSWEDDVIWDCDAMKKDHKPSILTLDPNDKNIRSDIYNDPEPDPAEFVKTKKDTISKSRVILGKAGILLESDLPHSPENIERDPFNISNDEYYGPYIFKSSISMPDMNNNIHHSIPALQLNSLYFPTHMGPLKREHFHRPPLKQFSYGSISQLGFHDVDIIVSKQEKAGQEMKEISNEKKYAVRIQDLSGKDGDLILLEYSEEYAPLLMQASMATKIKNYYKRSPDSKSDVYTYKYGEPAYTHSSPFLGSLAPGQNLQALENNMFRAPIYEHDIPLTDFLIIRTRQNYYMRSLETIFAVGQELPLCEVPCPNSKKASHFAQNFLQVFIHHLFRKSEKIPPRIKMEDVKKAFPSYSDSYIRKQLKSCADFKRTGTGINWWILKQGYSLPSEDDIEKMISPEECCSYYSMLAAEQRLKDAGYGKKSIFAVEEEEEEFQNKIEDEIKAAPWNVTKAFMCAMKGECFLELTGAVDPTGCGEGFSYVKIPFKHKQWREESYGHNHTKKTLTGTDADLRRLSLHDAKRLLKRRNVPEEEINKLSRWEIIDVVRTLSTEQVKAGEEEDMSKFARGNRFSMQEYQKRYKEECQRIFDLQNRVLSSNEILSTDEESSSDEDLEIEEMAKNIEIILSSKKTISQLHEEREEKERLTLHKLITEDDDKECEDISADVSCNISNKILKIYRSYRNLAGKSFLRTEIVRNPTVIDTYVRIRATKDQNLIKQLASASNDQEKEEIRKERRRIQDQLRRLKRNESRLIDELPKKKPKLEKKDALLKVKCGACNATGHMKTNRICPFYQPPITFPAIQVAMTEEQKKKEEISGLEDSDLVKVDETKVVISKQVIKHMDEIRRKSLILKIPKSILPRKKRKGSESSDEYRKKYTKNCRHKTDPLVVLSIILEDMLRNVRNIPGTEPFWLPVEIRKLSNYGKLVHDPMDLQTIQEKVQQKKYKSRYEFLKDIQQIVQNSSIYNGADNHYTITAQKMLDLCLENFSQKHERVQQLERLINPLLDDSGQLCFSNILEIIVTKDLAAIPGSVLFHTPMSKKAKKEYQKLVNCPINLNMIMEKIKGHKYQNRETFKNDINLILDNSITIYGPDSKISNKAKEIVDVCNKALEKWKNKLSDCEDAITGSQSCLDDASKITSQPSEEPRVVSEPEKSISLKNSDTVKEENDFASASQIENKDESMNDLNCSGENMELNDINQKMLDEDCIASEFLLSENILYDSD